MRSSTYIEDVDQKEIAFCSKCREKLYGTWRIITRFIQPENQIIADIELTIFLHSDDLNMCRSYFINLELNMLQQNLF